MKPRPRLALSAIACLTIALLVPSGPATSAAVQATVDLSRTSGPPGSKTTVHGSGYQANELVDVFEDTFLSTTTPADDGGAFSVTIKIQTFFGPGDIQIKGVGESSGLSAEATFTIRTNWAQFHFDAAHTGSNPFENLIFPDNVSLLIQRWTGLTSNNASDSSPVQVDGTVYVGWGDGLYAFSEGGCDPQSTCAPLWMAPSSPINTSPAVARGTVFVGADDMKLHAFDAATGDSLWVGPTHGMVRSSPTIARRAVFIGSNDKRLYAFRAAGCGLASCRPLWTGLTGGIILGSPAVAAGTVFVGSEDGLLYAFAAAGCGSRQCAPLWTGATGALITSGAAVVGGVAYVGSQDGKLYAFSAGGCGQATCSPLWTGDTGGAIAVSPAVGEGSVFVGADVGLFVFPSAGCGQSTCSPLWTASLPEPVVVAPALSNGVVYVYSQDLDAFEASGCGAPTCSPLATFTFFPGSTPIVTDGMVFVNSVGLKAFGFPPLGS